MQNITRSVAPATVDNIDTIPIISVVGRKEEGDRMDYIIAFVFVCCIGMLLRNEYVYRTMVKIANGIYKYQKTLIDEGKYDPIEAKRMYDYIYDYKLMVLKFYVFGWEQFVDYKVAEKIRHYM